MVNGESQGRGQEWRAAVQKMSQKLKSFIGYS